MNMTYSWNPSTFSLSDPYPIHSTPCLVQFIRTWGRTRQLEPQAEEAEGSISFSRTGPASARAASFWASAQVTSVFRSCLLYVGDPAPSFHAQGLDTHTHTAFTVLECPWVRACRGLDLFPRGLPPQRTHRGHNSESVAPPGREQACFTSPANVTHTGAIQPGLLSKGLC